MSAPRDKPAAELELLRALVRAALGSLQRSRGRVDGLNVYPVPDGDTGRNLEATAVAVARVFDSITTSERPALLSALAREAPMGARGQAGAILARMVSGAAQAAPAQGAIDARALAAMLKSASDSARAAVRRPVEGTMLTVVRELAEEARKRARKNPPLTELVPALLERAEQALARTPDELPALREAGVVDAGAAGLVELLRGIARELAGRPLEKTTPAAAPAASESKGAGFPARYCVVFAIEQKNIDATALERELEAIGDLLSLALGADKAQVHLHTDDPGAALRLGTGAGRLAGIAVARLEPGEREPGRLLSLIPPPR